MILWLMWSALWFGVFFALLTGVVWFVLAIVRWPASGWKYLLFIPAAPLLPVTAITGWILFFVGYADRRLEPPRVPIKPPPPPGYG